MGRIKSGLRDVRNVIRGFRFLKKNGYTPNESVQSMINLFCNTRGVSSDIFHWLISKFNRKAKGVSGAGILPFSNKGEAVRIAREIREKGYHIFPDVLPDDIVRYLHRFGTQRDAMLRPLEAVPNKILGKEKVNLENPKTIRYDFDEGELINDPIVQGLMTDSSIVQLAQEYLGCIPCANVTAMWWHTDFSKEANAEAATMWHFDMDHIKWLKFFFYITDVSPESGPHQFVEGTHRSRRIPHHLLRRGYARMTDEEIRHNYPESLIHEFTAKKGTLIVEDTRGLHRGKEVLKGARLMFQLTFSDHLFGAYYSEKKFTRFENKDASTFVAKYPKIFRKYLS